ncbi:hypothetical protein [Streptomyces sp. AMCC400023]|uniref:hypothetical protein n=1 Tax=Streptomyces sp. AMCC400023 TaxID=2056258 RepID=UPI001F44056F|nr:hypothetical protein [Streptomyces sp. AMCC400023]UJV42917.1 hypothetical protein CVT30_26520 [Streptomyces sp. AMCC400023]
MVSTYLLLLGASVDTVLDARALWGLPLATAVAVFIAGSDRVRTTVRALSGRVRVRTHSSPLTCPDTVRTPSADDRPDASGHIPGGGP